MSSNKARINAWISPMNYRKIDKLMSEVEIVSMRLSKGAILDLALTHFFNGLDCGESVENIAINHLEAVSNSKGDGD